jgi:hypothetical protein
MQLPDDPSKEDLLVWCDYLEMDGGQPPAAVQELRSLLATGLRPWPFVNHRGCSWDCLSQASQKAYPDVLAQWMCAGFLPARIYDQLYDEHSVSVTVEDHRVRRHAAYPTAALAWQALFVALCRLCNQAAA